MAGAPFGPIGMGIGAIAGGAAGIFGGLSGQKDAKKARQQQMQQQIAEWQAEWAAAKPEVDVFRSGLRGEFLHAPRLDNLASCHAGLTALLAMQAPAEATCGIILYDHEEVGSTSAQGAASPFLRHLLERPLQPYGEAGSGVAAETLDQEVPPERTLGEVRTRPRICTLALGLVSGAGFVVVAATVLSS